MKADASKFAAVMLFALAGTGCSVVQPPAPREQVTVWLAESPRSLAVEVDRQLPKVTLRTRDHHGGQRVASGAGGAVAGGVYTIGSFCASGGPFGCFIGVLFAPVGMVVGGVAGAVKVKSTDSVQSAANAGEGPAKMKLEQALDLPLLLESLVVANATTAGPHSLQAGPAAPDGEQGTLRLRFTEIEWFGDTGENPSLKFTLRVEAEMSGAGATVSDWGSYSFSGTSHWVSTWLKKDAKLLREELRTGANTIAAQVARDLRAKPTRQSVAKVAWARKRAGDPELDMWVRARDGADPRLLQSYLETYPQGRYVRDAQKRLADPDSALLEVWRGEEGKCFFC